MILMRSNDYRRKNPLCLWTSYFLVLFFILNIDLNTPSAIRSYN